MPAINGGDFALVEAEVKYSKYKKCIPEIKALSSYT